MPTDEEPIGTTSSALKTSAKKASAKTKATPAKAGKAAKQSATKRPGPFERPRLRSRVGFATP